MPNVSKYYIELETNVRQTLTDIKTLQDRMARVEGKEHKINIGVDSVKLEKVISSLDKMLDSLGKGSSDFKQFENLSKYLNEVKKDIADVKKTFGTLNDNGMNNIVTSINNINNSLTSLTEKLQIVKKDASGNIINTSSVGEISDLFIKIEQHLNALHTAFGEINSDNGLKPLINQIGELKSAMSGLKMNLNLDLGNMTKGSDIKVAETTRRWAQAYEELFNKIKLAGKATKEMYSFVKPENVNDAELVGIYKSMLGRAESKYATTSIVNGKKSKNNVFRNQLFTPYYKEIENARDAVTRATKSSKNGLSLENIFGKSEVDLSGVISELQAIAQKLDAISTSATKMGEAFKTGINVSTSVEEITKLTERVKQLEAELQKVKNINVTTSAITGSASNKTNISNGNKIDTAAIERTANSVKEATQAENEFATANKDVQTSVDGSKSPLQLEAAMMEQVAKSAKEAAMAKKEFVTANGQVGSSAKKSASGVQTEAEATKINNALNSTVAQRKSLTIPKDASVNADILDEKIKKLNQDLTSGKISIEEYGTAIKQAFNGFNTSVGDREKKVWDDLNNSLKRYEELRKRMASGNALSTDTKEAKQLLEHIHELQKNDILPTEKLNASSSKLEEIKQKVSEIKQKVKTTTLDSIQTKIGKYNNQYTKYSETISPENKSSLYTTNLANFQKAIKDLEEFKVKLEASSRVTEKQKRELARLESTAQKAAQTMKNMTSSQKGYDNLSASKIIQRANRDLQENTRYSKKAKEEINALISKLNSGSSDIVLKEILNDLIKIETAEAKAGRTGKSFMDIFKSRAVNGFIGQVQSYLSMYIGFYGMVNMVQKTVSTVVELDTALVDLQKTTTMSSSQLEKFYYDANDVAKQMGVTTQEIIEQASAWSRLNKIGLLYGDI